MPRLVYDFGKVSAPPVELDIAIVGNDYDVFASYFSSKILIGVKHESFVSNNISYYRRMHIELFPAGRNQRIASIDSVYPVLPTVPDNDKDPRKSLYSTYLKTLPQDTDPCIQQFRDNKFATIIGQESGQQPNQAKTYKVYTIDPEANIVFAEGITPPTGDAAKFKKWILVNPLDKDHKAVSNYKNAVYDPQNNNQCQVSSPIAEYVDSRTSLNIPENRRSEVKILLVLPFKG